jgi:broad specificity phosphatase PhoE
VDLYLVRHAEDRAAANARFGDEGLTPRGQAQARQLARALASVEFTRAESSPLLRARETVAILLEERSSPLEVVPDLAEGSVGALEGVRLDEARTRYPDDFRLGSTVVARLKAVGRTAPDGETREAFLARAQSAATRWRFTLDAPGGAALVVSHGGLLNFALQHLIGLPLRDEVPFGFDYAGVARLLSYEETSGFGPFVMLRFGVP